MNETYANTAYAGNSGMDMPAKESLRDALGSTVGNLHDAHNLLDRLEDAIMSRPREGSLKTDAPPHRPDMAEQVYQSRNLSQGLYNRISTLLEQIGS